MTEHIRLIRKKIEHLRKMKEYLAWSVQQVRAFVPISDWSALTPEQHESLAAFRIRFSEFQEHLGKTMRAIAIEEEENTEPFGAVLAFMEKMRILDSVEHWRLIRELRNSVNHEYEEDELRLTEFFRRLVDEAPALFDYFERMAKFVDKAYGKQPL
ncbi:MAG: hypothetical protein AB1744_00390 [Candidatus Zixiibacteriota bacterium]